MIKQALIKKLEGDIEVARADLITFLKEPIGVAEHIDYVVTAEKKLAVLAEAIETQVEIIAHAEDKLDSLKDLD